MTKIKEDFPVIIIVKIQKNYIDTENPIFIFSIQLFRILSRNTNSSFQRIEDRIFFSLFCFLDNCYATGSNKMWKYIEIFGGLVLIGSWKSIFIWYFLPRNIPYFLSWIHVWVHSLPTKNLTEIIYWTILSEHFKIKYKRRRKGLLHQRKLKTLATIILTTAFCSKYGFCGTPTTQHKCN